MIKQVLLFLLLAFRAFSNDVILVEVEEKMIGEPVSKHNELWSLHFTESTCHLHCLYTDLSGVTKDVYSALYSFDYTFNPKSPLVRLHNSNYDIEFRLDKLSFDTLSKSKHTVFSLNTASFTELVGTFKNESALSGKLITRTYKMKSPTFRLKI